MSRLPTRLQNQILLYVSQHAGIDSANIHSCTFRDPLRRYYTAWAPIDEAADSYLVFTLASYSHLVLVTVTDGDPAAVGALLAALEDFDTTIAALGIGHTVPLTTHRYAVDHGRCAAVLLPPTTSKLLSSLESVVEFDGQSCHFAFVLFLDEAEYRVKREQGLEALLDYLEATDRGLLKFAAPRRA